MATVFSVARWSTVWLRRRHPPSSSWQRGLLIDVTSRVSPSPPRPHALGRVGLWNARSRCDGVRPASHAEQRLSDRRLRTYRLEVPASSEGKLRLDVYLSEAVPEVTRARLQGCIKDGLVSVNGISRGKPGFKVKAGDEVVATLQPLPPLNAAPEDLPLQIVFEDDQLLVINKEPGMVTHPAPGNYTGTLVNAVLNHCSLPAAEVAPCGVAGVGQDELEEEREEEGMHFHADALGVIRPGIVHRLDKGTSGLLVVAKTEFALQALATQFKARTVDRTYVSITLGIPKTTQGRVETNIARDPNDRKRMAAFPYNEQGGLGRHAASNYKVVEELADGRAAVMAWKLETGRTHQIRVHAKEIGHPLLGDETYGGGKAAAADRLSRGSAAAKDRVMEVVEEFGRPALHAATLGFTHPVSGERIKFSAPLPLDMIAVLEALRGDLRATGSMPQ